jgi:uncharacterized short protein YbdD (DUF466 family)
MAGNPRKILATLLISMSVPTYDKGVRERRRKQPQTEEVTMKTRNRTYKDIPLGLIIDGEDSFDKMLKIRSLVMKHFGAWIGTSGISDAYILEICNRHPKALRQTILDFARGVLATLES